MHELPGTQSRVGATAQVLWGQSRTHRRIAPTKGRRYAARLHNGALGAATLLAALGVSGAARADVSSWLYLGGGASRLDDRSAEPRFSPDLQLDTGIGTPPADSLIFGGLFRMQTHFGRGTDLGLLVRGATHGFVNGDWGLAVDAGPYVRWWGVGSNGVWGGLNLGAPWGITASANAGFGSEESQTYSFTIGIDFARLTVYRRSGEEWWRNPFPAYRPDEKF
ncbi:MAG: hypothetical protein H6718_24995 [Polyangiaceae bacterium]|nr:hypothetical protein [Polyangiaceae bacterium]MCB9605249.1 hypothetical protein [Polyangiaceae bacterium]